MSLIGPKRRFAATQQSGAFRGKADTDTRAQSSRLAEFGGRGMSFNICRGTLGSLVHRDKECLVARELCFAVDLRPASVWHGLMIHQREHDFGYGDKADRERDNGDGELITDHLPASLHHDHEKGRPFRDALTPCRW